MIEEESEGEREERRESTDTRHQKTISPMEVRLILLVPINQWEPLLTSSFKQYALTCPVILIILCQQYPGS